MAASHNFHRWSPLRISPLHTVTSRSQLALYLHGRYPDNCERTSVATEKVNCRDSRNFWSGSTNFF